MMQWGRAVQSSLIGKPVARLEDDRLLRGSGCYSDDVRLPQQSYAAFVRSPHAHAEIRRIDTRAACQIFGVIAVLTGADYVADGLKGITYAPNPLDALDIERQAFAPHLSWIAPHPPHVPLAIDKVRHVGEPVAVVIATEPSIARSAAEAVDVEYEPLTPLVTPSEACTPGAPAIWSDAPDNVALRAEIGDRTLTDAMFRNARWIVEHVFPNNRVVSCHMEPRAAVGDFSPATGVYTLISGSQGAGRQKSTLVQCLGVPADKVRVVCPDVGGAFGARTLLYPEQLVVVWAAKRVGRPVKWTVERSEGFLSDYQGRDITTKATLGIGADGRIVALRSELIGNLGARPLSFSTLANYFRVAPTVYAISAAHLMITAVLTNTIPTYPYRGAGRPEATFVMERLLDIAAEQTGIDRMELRRKNLIQQEALPYRTAMGLTLNSGSFIANMEEALRLSDWNDFPQRKKKAAERQGLLGFGVANYIEAPVGYPYEKVSIDVAPDRVVVTAGTQSTGQGHETSFAQVVAHQLGLPLDRVRVRFGDTAIFADGGGTHSDRSMRIAGTLLFEASNALIAKLRIVAAKLLDVLPDTVSFDDGLFRAAGLNAAIDLFEIAQAIAGESPELLSASAELRGRIPAYPTGCAACEVEVDPETGLVAITRYVTVDDVGRPINPLIVHGQVHGGIAQGIGQALVEHAQVEPGSGQVLTGSFMDYGLPRAAHLPPFVVEFSEDPITDNPLGIKGAGEAGTTPAAAAIMNALLDALHPCGVTDISMPASPSRIWNSIVQARRMKDDLRRAAACKPDGPETKTLQQTAGSR